MGVDMMDGVKMGSISVLNVSEGDMKFSFLNDDPLEVERARRVVVDMLRRGYALFIADGEGKLKRVKKFDEVNDCYIIADGAEVADANTDADERPAEEKPKRKAERPRSVSARNTRMVGIAPTAGG